MTRIVRKLGTFKGAEPTGVSDAQQKIDSEIRGFADLAEEEFSEYLEAFGELKRFETQRQLVLLLLMNYKDFDDMVDGFFHDWKEGVLPAGFSIDNVSLDINRRVLNFLSSFRTYLDHTETRLTREFRDDSSRVDEFKTLCSYHYDNCFAYRFMYELRNYAQHYDMPVGNMRLQSNLDEESHEVSYSMGVLFNRDALLRNRKWKNILREEISALETEFDVRPFIQQIVNCVLEIDKRIAGRDLSEALEGAEYIEKLMEPIKETVGTAIIFEYDFDEYVQKKRMPPLEIHYIPVRIMEMVFQLKQLLEA